MPSAYGATLSVEAKFGDIRDVCIDDETTCADVMGAVKDAHDSEAELAMLEYVYDACDKLRQVRKIEGSQKLQDLVPSLLAPMGSLHRSALAVVDLRNATVVFFNPFFRMSTGLPHEHLTFYPDAMMSVGEFNRMIRTRLGIKPDATAVALHGNFGHSVSLLGDEQMLVASLRAANDDSDSPKFFQFQVRAEFVDHERLGVVRASDMYVRKHEGILPANRKLFLSLQGTTIYAYKASKTQNRTADKVHVIDRVDECHIVKEGHNAIRSKFFLVLEHPSGTRYTLTTGYPKRLQKWSDAIRKCHPVIDSQTVVTARSLAGLPEQEALRRRQHQAIAIKDDEPEPTDSQRMLLERPDQLLKMLKATDTSDTFLETMRQLLAALTELPLPGYASEFLPMLHALLAKIAAYAESPTGEERDNLMDECIRIAALHKTYVMEEAPLPENVDEDERMWSPRMFQMRQLLSDTDYHKLFSTQENERAMEEGHEADDETSPTASFGNLIDDVQEVAMNRRRILKSASMDDVEPKKPVDLRKNPPPPSPILDDAIEGDLDEEEVPLRRRNIRRDLRRHSFHQDDYEDDEFEDGEELEEVEYDVVYIPRRRIRCLRRVPRSQSDEALRAPNTRRSLQGVLSSALEADGKPLRPLMVDPNVLHDIRNSNQPNEAVGQQSRSRPKPPSRTGH